MSVVHSNIINFKIHKLLSKSFNNFEYLLHFYMEYSLIILYIKFQGEIIRKKSTEGLPFPIILTGTLVSFLWLLYGIATRINFVILQNGVIFAMSVVQLSLFAIFPATPAKPKNNGNNKKKN